MGGRAQREKEIPLRHPVIIILSILMMVVASASPAAATRPAAHTPTRADPLHRTDERAITTTVGNEQVRRLYLRHDPFLS